MSGPDLHPQPTLRIKAGRQFTAEAHRNGLRQQSAGQHDFPGLPRGVQFHMGQHSQGHAVDDLPVHPRLQRVGEFGGTGGAGLRVQPQLSLLVEGREGNSLAVQR